MRLPGPQKLAVAFHEIGGRDARVRIVRRRGGRGGGERDEEG
jgi:hypothetical protein